MLLGGTVTENTLKQKLKCISNQLTNHLSNQKFIDSDTLVTLAFVNVEATLCTTLCSQVN